MSKHLNIQALLAVQVSFFNQNLPVGRRRRCRCCRKLFTFLSYLQNHWANF